MDFKYKIADVAKEFGVPAKKVIETVSGVTGTAYKTGGTFEEKELIESIRNYCKSYPDGYPHLLEFAQDLFDRMTDMPR